MKRFQIENQFAYPISKSIKRQLLSHAWPIENSKKFKKNASHEQQQHRSHCFIYLKFFPSTLKCSLDVLVQSNDKSPPDDSILIAKTSISKVIKTGSSYSMLFFSTNEFFRNYSCSIGFIVIYCG